MKTTHTYLNSTYFSPVKLAELQGFQPEQEDVDYAISSNGLSGFISAIWLWLRCCLFVATGHGDPYESDVEFVERPHPYGRARRHQAAHFARRREIVPARCLAPFYYLGSRRITRAQFMERLCRLSGWGRISVYRMGCGLLRMLREALRALLRQGGVFKRGELRVSCGFCEAHLWPG